MSGLKVAKIWILMERYIQNKLLIYLKIKKRGKTKRNILNIIKNSYKNKNKDKDNNKRIF